MNRKAGKVAIAAWICAVAVGCGDSGRSANSTTSGADSQTTAGAGDGRSIGTSGEASGAALGAAPGAVAGEASGAGFGQASGAGQGGTSTDGPTSSATAAPGTAAGGTNDTDFVQFAAMSSMAEIELGRVAQKQASATAVKQYGQRMVADHTKATTQLKQAAGAAAPMPAQLDAKHRQAMEMLSSLSGSQFDREYMRMMVDDHREAVERFTAEARRSGGASSTSTSSTGANGSTAGAAASGTSGAGASSPGETRPGVGATGTAGTTAGTNAGAGASRTGSGSDNPRVASFAQQTLPTLQEHLRMAQQVQSDLK